MKLVLPAEGEPRRRIVRLFFGVVWGGATMDDIFFLLLFFEFSSFSNRWEIL